MPLDDAPAARGRRAAVREREEALVASLRALGPALDGEPDPTFRTATRARLVAMAAVRTPEPAPAPRSVLSRLRPEPSAPAWSPVRRRLTAGLTGGALAVSALATLVAVASGAAPGDPLYELKRGTERTQLALSGSDRGLTLLGFAETRLTELSSLAGSGDPALAVRTLRDMDDETTAGTAAVTARAVQDRDPATARRLASWGADRSAQLSALRPQLPAGVQPAVDETAALIGRVTDRGTALAAAIGCAAGPSLGSTDALGPVPLDCASTPASAPVQGAAGGGSAGSSSVPGTAGTPAVPTPATGGSGGAPPVTGGSGGSVPGGSVPGRVVPPVPGLPTTGLPSPKLPGTGTVTVPPAGTPRLPSPGTLLPTSPAVAPPLLPGTTPTTSSGGTGTSTGTGTAGLPGVSVCLPPVTIGSC